MSYNGTGTFNINTAGQPVVSGTVISSTAFNALTADLASGLSTAITKDGQTTPTANIKLGGYKLTGVGNPTTSGDALNFGGPAGTPSSITLTYGTGLPLSTGVTGTLPVANGGTGLTSFTANGVMYASSTSALATSSALTFDGTTALSSPQVVATQSISGSSTKGAFNYGTLSYSDTGHLSSMQASLNQYIQCEIQNTNSGAAASADMIVGNNNTTATTYYGDFGMNSSGWAGTAGTSSLTAPNMVYLTATSSDLTLGTTTSNKIRFVVNGGADAAIIDTAGNVGIGTSSPLTKLHAMSAASSVTLALSPSNSNTNIGYVTNDSTYMMLSSSVGSTGNKFRVALAAPDSAATIDSSGNLLVGTTSATAKIAVLGASTTSANIALYAGNSSGQDLFYARCDGLINTGTRTSSPYNNTTASAANMFVSSAGDIARSTSSLKYKTNVQDATHGLTELLALRPVTYEGKAESDAGKTFGGLIAEEVHEAGLIEFVQYAEDGSPDALAYGNMISLCVKAIQEQQAIITQLQADVAALKGQA